MIETSAMNATSVMDAISGISDSRQVNQQNGQLSLPAVLGSNVVVMGVDEYRRMQLDLANLRCLVDGLLGISEDQARSLRSRRPRRDSESRAAALSRTSSADLACGHG